MSWIEKELKRRKSDTRQSTTRLTLVESEPGQVPELWRKIENANRALPDELQLRYDPTGPSQVVLDKSGFVAWLRAPNGAALGLTAEAIRYLWPEGSQRRSNNFWIRWDAERKRYVLIQRTSARVPPSIATYTFDEGRIELLLKGLVLGQRVRARSLRRKRWRWF